MSNMYVYVGGQPSSQICQLRELQYCLYKEKRQVFPNFCEKNTFSYPTLSTIYYTCMRCVYT